MQQRIKRPPVPIGNDPAVISSEKKKILGGGVPKTFITKIVLHKKE